MPSLIRKEGLIYCVKNSLFPHLIKIGKTTAETVEARGLNSSNVPEDFETIFAYKVRDIDAVEKSVHSVLDEFRYKSKSGRTTEFFYACASERARKHIIPFSIEDKTFDTELEVDTDDNGSDEITELKYDESDLVSWEDLRLMRPANDKFRTEENAKTGWLRATNSFRMTFVRVAKKEGAWKNSKLSLSWLKSKNYFNKIMEINWDDYK